MTRDIFAPVFGTLDIIIYAVLHAAGLRPLRLNTYEGSLGADGIAAANAAMFRAHFGDRKIQAIKAVREISGLSLRDAKEAVEQIDETYGDARTIARMAQDRLIQGDVDSARALLGLIT